MTITDITSKSLAARSLIRSQAETWLIATYPQVSSRLHLSRYLQREWHGRQLLPAVIQAAYLLKDVAGIKDLLWALSQSSGQIQTYGLAHELIRLAQIYNRVVSLKSLGREIQLPPNSAVAPDAVTSKNCAIEIKLCADGLDRLPYYIEEQAERYARAMRLNLINGLIYVITVPYIRPAFFTALAQIVPGAQVHAFHHHDILETTPSSFLTTPKLIQ